MLTVYRVIPNPTTFQEIGVDDIPSLMKIPFDGTPLRTTWVPLDVYSPHPTLPEGDFWGCFGNNAIFAVTEGGGQLLVTFLDQSCEGLPVMLDARRLLICNVIHIVNCLDTAKSEHKPGIPGWVTKYAFHGNRFEYSLFKLPETRRSEVLCVEGLAAPEDEFRGTVEKHGLRGLIFKEVWRSG
jgi:hypothetical protein